MKIYKPSYLYIKTHNKTGLKYFGKTVQDPYVYKGSGHYWKIHIDSHGYDVTTEVLNNGNPYKNEYDFKKVAEEFSLNNNIVESSEWANLKIETGDGGDTSMCENYINAITSRDMSGRNNPMWGKTSFAKGRTYEALYGEEKANTLKKLRTEAATGRKLSKESLKKLANSISKATKGIPKSEKHRNNMKKPKTQEHKDRLKGPREKIKCPHCNLIGGISQMKRWHFENCKTYKEN
jgi:hypothetical protein